MNQHAFARKSTLHSNKNLSLASSFQNQMKLSRTRLIHPKIYSYTIMQIRCGSFQVGKWNLIFFGFQNQVQDK